MGGVVLAATQPRSSTIQGSSLIRCLLRPRRGSHATSVNFMTRPPRHPRRSHVTTSVPLRRVMRAKDSRRTCNGGHVRLSNSQGTQDFRHPPTRRSGRVRPRGDRYHHRVKTSRISGRVVRIYLVKARQKNPFRCTHQRRPRHVRCKGQRCHRHRERRSCIQVRVNDSPQPILRSHSCGGQRSSTRSGHSTIASRRFQHFTRGVVRGGKGRNTSQSYNRSDRQHFTNGGRRHTRSRAYRGTVTKQRAISTVCRISNVSGACHHGSHRERYAPVEGPTSVPRSVGVICAMATSRGRRWGSSSLSRRSRAQ